jgi:hypothetical protein
VHSQRFAAIATRLARRNTRRSVLGGLTALGLTRLVPADAGAVCASPGDVCGRNGSCCSGVCGKNHARCTCPQRLCCQCSPYDPVPCAYVADHAACAERCRKLTGRASSTVSNPTPGMQTTRCAGTFCRPVDCVPTEAIPDTAF